MSFNVYVGPYLLIEDVKETSSHTVKVKACTCEASKKNKVKPTGNFCSFCGEKLSLVSKDEERGKSWGSVFYEIDVIDQVFDVTEFAEAEPNQNIFISNFNNEHLDLNEPGTCPLSTIFNNEHNTQFIERLKPILKYAENHNLKYDIEYGIVTYNW